MTCAQQYHQHKLPRGIVGVCVCACVCVCTCVCVCACVRVPVVQIQTGMQEIRWKSHAHSKEEIPTIIVVGMTTHHAT